MGFGGGGLNLHGLVRGAIQSVNTDVNVTWRQSSGSAVGPSGKRTPSYNPDVMIRGNVQALTYKDLMQLDGLNLNGEKRAIYLFGDKQGVVRPNAQGGDLIVDAGGSTWLVVQSLEQWPTWCKVAVTLQNDVKVNQ